MIKDCIAVFLKERDQHGIKRILDNYIPADGLYVIVNPDGSLEELNIKMDKKTRMVDRSSLNFQLLCKYDYHSKYLNSNKAVDPKKIIQSNNYLSFIIKKESLTNGKLTEQLIDGYFDIIADPYKKYSKANAKSLYQEVEQSLPPIDLTTLEKNRNWIKENIFKFNCEGKDYLKIYFRADEGLYEQEGRRYFIPNLYNSNDFNIVANNSIKGLSDNNLGMNSKKPYLENKNRKVTLPYLVTQDEALLQKEFFDLLLTFNMQGKNNVFINTEEKEIIPKKNGEFPPGDFYGIYLRIQKGKTESEIHYQNVISSYHEGIRKLRLRNVLDYQRFKDQKIYGEYRDYTSKKEVQKVLDEVFFNNMLVHNYFTKPEELSIKEGYLKSSILQARQSVFDWLYNGQEFGLWEVLNQVSLRLIIGSIERGYWQKAVRQYNLRISLLAYLKGENKMEDKRQAISERLFNKINSDTTSKIDSDEEYYYAVGQLVQYYISLSKSGKKTHSLVNPFINAGGDKIIKQKLLQYYKKYNYNIEWRGKRFKNLYAMVSEYKSPGPVLQDDMIAGILSNCLIYEKKKEENNDDE